MRSLAILTVVLAVGICFVGCKKKAFNPESPEVALKLQAELVKKKDVKALLELWTDKALEELAEFRKKEAELADNEIKRKYKSEKKELEKLTNEEFLTKVLDAQDIFFYGNEPELLNQWTADDDSIWLDYKIFSTDKDINLKCKQNFVKQKDSYYPNTLPLKCEKFIPRKSRKGKPVREVPADKAPPEAAEPEKKGGE